MPVYIIDNDFDQVVENVDTVLPLNPVRALEQRMAAMACLMICKFQGELLLVQNLDADPVSLYMLPYSGRNEYGQFQRMKADAAIGKFDIPLQEDFDGSYASLVNGGSIRFNGQWFQIQSIESDALNAVFTANCTARTARVI